MKTKLKMGSFAPVFIRNMMLLAFIVMASAHLAKAQSILCEEVFEQKPSWFYVKDVFVPHAPRMGRDLTVRDLMEPNGDIWLFRVNGGLHVDGEVGYYTEQEAGRVSTSLSPQIAFQWSPKSKNFQAIAAPTYILIIKQNIFRHEMWYPIDANKFPDEGVAVTPLRREKVLTENTSLDEILFFEEVKVAPSDLNVVAQVPLQDFNDILARNYYPRSFHPKDLAKVLSQKYRTAPAK